MYIETTLNGKEVDEDILKRILHDAQWAPSWCNVAPYYICLARGEQKERIKSNLLYNFDQSIKAQRGGIFEKLRAYLSGVLPDGDYDTQIKYDDDLKKHRRDCGFGLYNHLGIQRDDKDARNVQVRRNFEFFDAPVVLFVFVHGNMGPFAPLDCGFYLQNLVLSAHANGLGSCVQGALAMWGTPVREEFPDIPDQYKLICGISLGYASTNKINSFNPGRREPRGSFQKLFN